MENNDIVLKLNKVSKSYGKKHVLKNIDLTIRKGTIMGLIGKNGAGKTTMIKALLGLLKLDTGKATIFGEDSWDLPGEVKHRIGYVPQKITGSDWMTVQAFLDYTGAFYKKWDSDKVSGLMKEWDIDPKAKFNTLSEGEKQKVAIILAMGHDPELFVFDEPVASLDPASRRAFIGQLIDLNLKNGTTMLFSTHITSDLERIAADIAFLKDKEIKYIGDLAELKEKYSEKMNLEDIFLELNK